MRNLTTTLCLFVAVLLGGAGVTLPVFAEGNSTQKEKSEDAEFLRGFAAIKNFNRALKAQKSGDFSHSYEAFRPLAEFGLPAAQHNLAYLYETGKGTRQDISKAVRWYEKAGQQGYVQSQVNLALMYTRGSGVPKDHPKAFFWWKKAAENGFTTAQAVLGAGYMEGKLLRKNLVKAHMWLSIAASSDFAKAKGLLSTVAEQLTPAQIAEAQKLARECVRKKYKGC